jgi:preprotein translocase subunit SecA
MKTGEGKTLVSTLPVYLNALTGRGVHVVTVNDYLASFQSEWMGRIYRWLGLSVGLVVPGRDNDFARVKAAYDCDITYGTNNEFGFDYLRDNMATSRDRMRQRGHVYAIVDEVDSILIDEARTPLIISAPSNETARLYAQFAGIVRSLQRDVDYEVDEEKRTVAPTEAGIEKVEKMLGVENMYDLVSANYVHQLQQALRAKELYKRDKDYIVLDREVKIVDEFTGRILEGRRWSEGLHQAVEAKERVPIKEENHTYATVTLQNYFRMYEKLAGMTGTAETEASEFATTYGLSVVPIPTHRPMVRIDHADLIYKTEQAKFDAVIEDLVERYDRGQPVLVGTASVEKSEVLSRMLEKRGIPHSVLNAKRGRRPSSPRPAASTPSPWPPTWPVEASTSSSVETPRAWPPKRSPRRVSTRRARRAALSTCACSRSTTSSARPRATRSASWAACTCSAASATRAGASTTSSVGVPDVRATRVRAASSCLSRTT